MRGAANFFVCEAEELLSGLPAGLVFFADPRSLLCLDAASALAASRSCCAIAMFSSSVGSFFRLTDVGGTALSLGLVEDKSRF